MRPQKVEKEELLGRLMTVIRAKGYDGASLNDLAEASGLKKASLYHRYPGGKKDIAVSVMQYADEWAKAHVFDILQDSSKKPKTRIRTAVQNIRALYEDGEAICIIRALTTENGLSLFGDELKDTVQDWLIHFSQFGQEVGLSKKAAEELSMNTVIGIQGSLVVAKALRSKEPFLNAMQEIENNYLKLLQIK